MTTRRLAVFALASVALAALALSGCKKPTEEDRIRAMLKDAAGDAEAGKVRSVMDHVADDFSDGEGNDKKTVQLVLAGEVLRGKITIFMRDVKVTVTGETATVGFDAILGRGDRKSFAGRIPTESGAYHFALTLKKVDGEWLVSGGTWEQVDAKRFLLGE